MIEIKEFNTGDIIEVNTPKELKEVLMYCNPLMMQYYRKQLPQLEIRGFGSEIRIIRKEENKE